MFRRLLERMFGSTEVARKLHLGMAYLDMGDKAGAKKVLAEVVAEGNEEERKRTEALLSQIS